MVCVVYAVDDEDTLDSVTDHWLPLLRLDWLLFFFISERKNVTKYIPNC